MFGTKLLPGPTIVHCLLDIQKKSMKSEPKKWKVWFEILSAIWRPSYLGLNASIQPYLCDTSSGLVSIQPYTYDTVSGSIIIKRIQSE